MRDMFSIFHKAQEMTASDFAEAMEERRKAFLDIALIGVPDSRPAQNLADLPRDCDWGTKKDSKGKKQTWRGVVRRLDGFGGGGLK